MKRRDRHDQWRERERSYYIAPVGQDERRNVRREQYERHRTDTSRDNFRAHQQRGERCESNYYGPPAGANERTDDDDRQYNRKRSADNADSFGSRQWRGHDSAAGNGRYYGDAPRRQDYRRSNIDSEDDSISRPGQRRRLESRHSDAAATNHERRDCRFENHPRRSTTTSNRTPMTQEKHKAIVRNRMIIELGRQQRWKDLLDLHYHERGSFGNVNYATMMSKLSRIESLSRKDPSFIAFVEDISNQMKNRGLKWMGLRETSNIVHSIAKMKLKSKETNDIMELVSTEESSKWIVENGNTQDIANVVHAFETLGIESTKLFAEIEKRPECVDKDRQLLSIIRNREIIKLGGQQRWKDLLVLYDGEKESFDNINYATMMNQFSKIDSLHKSDPLFVTFVKDVASAMKTHGLEWMGIRQTTNIMNCIAAMNLRSKESNEIMGLVSTDSNRKWMAGKNKRNEAVVGNREIIKLGKQQRWKDILALYHDEGESFDNINYSTVMTQFSKMSCVDKSDPSFVAFVKDLASTMKTRGLEWMGAREAINTVYSISLMDLRSKESNDIVELVSSDSSSEWVVENANTQEVANIAGACSSLGIKTTGLFTEIQKRAQWLVKEGKPQEIANTAKAFGVLRFKVPTLCREIEKRSEWLVMEGTAKDVSITAWSFAALGFESPPLFTEIGKREYWLVNEGGIQSVANLAWAYVKLGIDASTLFREIEKRAEWLVKDGMTEGLTSSVATTAWASAKLGIKSSNFFKEINHRASWLVTEGDRQTISNTAWAFAKLGFKLIKLFKEIEKRSEWLVADSGNPQHLANTAWASATLAIKIPCLFSVIEKEAKWLLRVGNPQDVANTFWAASQFNYDTPDLASEVDAAGEWLVRDGTEQNIGNIALSFVTIGSEATTFFTAVEANIEKIIESGQDQSISIILYSFVVLDLGKKHRKAVSMLWEYFMRMNDDQFNIECLRLMYQVYELAKVDGLNLTEPPRSLCEKMRNMECEETISEPQQRISSCLTEIGFVHEEEVSPIFDGKTGGLFSIDMACRKRKIAVEFDGPNHYLVKLPAEGKVSRKEDEVLRKEAGPTKAKRRYLERSGWKVINLNYQDMKKIDLEVETDAERVKLWKLWLTEELTKAGVVLEK